MKHNIRNHNKNDKNKLRLASGGSGVGASLAMPSSIPISSPSTSVPFQQAPMGNPSMPYVDSTQMPSSTSGKGSTGGYGDLGSLLGYGSYGGYGGWRDRGYYGGYGGGRWYADGGSTDSDSDYDDSSGSSGYDTDSDSSGSYGNNDYSSSGYDSGYNTGYNSSQDNMNYGGYGDPNLSGQDGYDQSSSNPFSGFGYGNGNQSGQSGFGFAEGGDVEGGQEDDNSDDNPDVTPVSYSPDEDQPTETRRKRYTTEDLTAPVSPDDVTSKPSRKSSDDNNEYNPNLASDRKRFLDELNNNDDLKSHVANILAGEQGTHPNGILGVLESGANRASLNKTSLAKEFRTTGQGGYYAGYKPSIASRDDFQQSFNDALDKFGRGSNVSKYATDNASGNFARGRIASGLFKHQNLINGEYLLSPGNKNARGYKQYPSWVQSMQPYGAGDVDTMSGPGGSEVADNSNTAPTPRRSYTEAELLAPTYKDSNIHDAVNRLDREPAIAKASPTEDRTPKIAQTAPNDNGVIGEPAPWEGIGNQEVPAIAKHEEDKPNWFQRGWENLKADPLAEKPYPANISPKPTANIAPIEIANTETSNTAPIETANTDFVSANTARPEVANTTPIETTNTAAPFAPPVEPDLEHATDLAHKGFGNGPSHPPVSEKDANNAKFLNDVFQGIGKQGRQQSNTGRGQEGRQAPSITSHGMNASNKTGSGKGSNFNASKLSPGERMMMAGMIISAAGTPGGSAGAISNALSLMAQGKRTEAEAAMQNAKLDMEKQKMASSQDIAQQHLELQKQAANRKETPNLQHIIGEDGEILSFDPKSGEVKSTGKKGKASADTELKVIGTNADGSPKYGAVDKKTGKVVGQQDTTSAGAAPLYASTDEIPDDVKKDPDKLEKTLVAMGKDPTIVSAARSFSEYTGNPKDVTMKGNSRQVAKNLAKVFNKDYDDTNYAGRQALQKDFMDGKSAASLTSLDTGLGHLQEADDNVNGLKNWTNSSLINSPVNWARAQTDKEFASAMTKFDASKQVALGEVKRAVENHFITEGERDYYEKLFSSNNSPTALHAGISEFRNIMASRFSSLVGQYNRGMGYKSDNPRYKQSRDFISPEHQEMFDRYYNPNGTLKSVSSTSAPTSTTNIPTVSTAAQYNALKSGSQYIDPNGKLRTKQ